MKNRLLFSVLMFFVFLVPLHSQAAGVKKFPGESATVQWANPSSDDSKVTGWRIYSSATQLGTQSPLMSVPNTARQAVFPVSFSTNSVMVFYWLCGYVTSGTTTLESDRVPLGGMEVDMNVVLPVGPSIK